MEKIVGIPPGVSKKALKKVALLATGNEIINGDTLNTNAPYFAHLLIEAHIQPGLHMTASDDESEITECILHLLDRHQALIIIGGLGPTSDDRTRFALAKALQKQLIFDQNTWQQVNVMLKDKGLAVPEVNRTQCWFPAGAEIIANTNGTAFACYLQHHGKDVFMLPGPPNECRPIFYTAVLPQLLELGYQHIHYRRSWLLFGVSESAIAAVLDPLAKDSGCYIGYRISYPYLEIKLESDNEQNLIRISNKILPHISQKLISTENKKASEQFYQYLKATDKKIYIDDSATLGALQNSLVSPKTRNNIVFCAKHVRKSDDFLITITGLQEYWEGIQVKFCELAIEITQHQTTLLKYEIPYRGHLSITYAVELISNELLNFFNKL